MSENYAFIYEFISKKNEKTKRKLTMRFLNFEDIKWFYDEGLTHGYQITRTMTTYKYFEENLITKEFKFYICANHYNYVEYKKVL